MENALKNCQSYGMPLMRDAQGGGTNVDRTKSVMYCSHCYQKGQFTLPKLTVDEMKVRVKAKLKEFGFPGFMKGLFTLNIPKLNGGGMSDLISSKTIQIIQSK